MGLYFIKPQKIKLSSWYIKEISPTEFQAKGIVRGQPRLGDGKAIHTSLIEGMRYDPEKERILMDTESGNHYELLLSEARLEYLGRTKRYMNRLGLSPQILDKCGKLQEEAKEAKKKYAGAKIRAGELYLEMAGVRVLSAWFKKQEENLREFSVSELYGMLMDSVVIEDPEEEQSDFRYFPFGRFECIMEPYHWSKDILALLIENVGRDDIQFMASQDREILCRAGEITRIGREEYKEREIFGEDELIF